MKEFKVGDRVVSKSKLKGMIFELDGSEFSGNPIGVVFDNGSRIWFSSETDILHHDDAKEFPRLMEVRNEEGREWVKF